MSYGDRLLSCGHCPHFAYRDHVSTTTGLPVMQKPRSCPAQRFDGHNFATNEPGVCCFCGADADVDTVDYDGYDYAFSERR